MLAALCSLSGCCPWLCVTCHNICFLQNCFFVGSLGTASGAIDIFRCYWLMGRSAFGSTLRESALLSSNQHLRWKDGLVSHWLCGRPSLDLRSLTLETVWAFPIAVSMMENERCRATGTVWAHRSTKQGGSLPPWTVRSIGLKSMSGYAQCFIPQLLAQCLET